MASRFVLTAQVQLQAPTNTRQVVNQIQQQLRGVNVQVNLQGGQQASRQINNLNQATQQATTAADRMGRAFGASIRRFGAFTIATRAVSLFTNSLANATKEAIDFEREMVKISQVTGKTMAQLKGLENTITDLSTSLGVSSKSILSVGRILSQAGVQAKDLEVALRTLAKTELAPTFDDITQTAEGAVAILAQFGEGVGQLERQLGAINRVAGQFAVESGDLISVIRRTGGVFKAAGGDLEELIALFTSVRATTRESAESIATGLRTIFTRIQRPATIEFLKQFGIELTDLNGKFVGPFEAIRQLSGALSGLEQGDIQFVRIAEELGGFRQIGKVIPLLQQFETAEKARQAALEGGDSLTKDAAKAQQALAVQIAKVKEEFLALIRSITQTGSFQTFVKTSLELASALIKVADALKPLIPLLATFGAIRFARGAAGFARGIGAGLRGGSPTGFARGGMVPGTGNRDTVPAMLTPGEFVIRKSSVSKLGAGTLAAMNENRFNRGARIKKELDTQRGSTAFDFKKGATIQAGKGGSGTLKAALSQADLFADADNYQAVFLRPEARGKQFKGQILKSNLDKAIKEALSGTGISSKQVGVKQIADRYASKNKFNLTAGSLTAQESGRLESTLLDGIDLAARKGAKEINGSLGIQGEKNIATALRSANIDQVLGNLFEVVLTNAGAPFGKPDTDPPNAPFDFPSGLGKVAKNFGLKTGIKTEAKSFFSESNLATINKKVQNELINESVEELRGIYRNFLSGQGKPISLSDAKKAFGSTKLGVGDITRLAEQQGLNFNAIGGGKYSLTRRNAGGSIAASDTVPALLTPGEFVFNKKAAQSIGYSNLSRMNTKGVQGFAKGGPVGLNVGGPVPGSFASDTLLKTQIEITKEQIKALGDNTRQQEAIEKVTKENEENQRRGSRRGRGVSSSELGTSLIFAASSLAAFIPEAEGATEGLGAVQNVLGETVLVGSTLVGLGAQFGPVGAAAAGLGAAFLGSIKIIDAYNGVHLKATATLEAANEATDERSIVEAENAAVASAGQKALNKLAIGAAATGAAIGAIGGPVGAAIGGVVGGLVGLGVKLFATAESAQRLSDFFAAFGFGQLGSQIKANTRFTIENNRAQKVLAEASKQAAEELKKIQSGEASVFDAVGEGGSVDAISKAVERVSAAGASVIAANKEQEKFLRAAEKTPFGKLLVGLSGARGRLAQSEEGVAKQQEQLRTSLVNAVQPFTNELTRSIVTSAAAGGGDGSSATFDQFFDRLSNSTQKQLEQAGAVDKLREQFENQKKAVIENIKFVKAMNFGLSAVTSGIDAYGASLNNLVASQETGFSTAAVAATTLSTAISSAGANISGAELGQSLDLLEGNLQKFGANAKQITGARELITGLNNVQKGAADALAAVKAGFKGSSADPKALQGQLRDAILSSIPDDSPIKQKLIDSFGNIDLPPEAVQEFLNTGDVSGVLDAAFGPISEQVQKQLIEPLNKLAEQEKVLIGLAQQRREAEQKLISVQKQAIETQIDAAKSLEFFGGPKFTPEREFAARRQQANLTLQDAGIAGLTTGSAADIRRASQSIGSRFSTQQAAQNAAAIRGGGAFGGVAGVDRDRRPELKEANQALLTITKQGIEQRKQELELIKKKNQAEKDALNSLLGGDVESFFDQAIGAAAGSALRTGDAAAASLFGAGALGKGLQGLQGTGLSDAENLRASRLAFGAFGLGDDAARTFSGTTTEEERIKSEGRELAQLQSELADQSVELEEMTVTATTVVISAANLKMQEISDQVQRAQSIAGFNRGGVVYANRGMFIPRGTDTVPAMLTPGEFVVNRAAVQRGNNLQILRSMNSNSAPIQATQALSSGGPVRYRANGSTGPEGPGGIDFSKFEEMVNKFQEVTDKLGNVNIKHMFEKLGTLDINHMFNGNMQQAFKDEILAEAGNMMSRSKFNSDGSITTSDRSVLG